jgi:hypothetical protein
MRSRGHTVAGAAVTLILLLTGCGGANKAHYTYSFTASDTGGLTKGIYLSVTSPIPLPASVLRRGGKRVDHVVGPRACSIKQVVEHAPKRYAEFNGKTLTLEVFGTTSVAKLICRLARNAPSTQVFGSQ